jgi:hypothetical protein
MGMKTNIREVAERYSSMTIRFAHVYPNGVVTNVEQNKRIITTDVVKGEGDLQRLVVKAVRQLSNGKVGKDDGDD